MEKYATFNVDMEELRQTYAQVPAETGLPAATIVHTRRLAQEAARRAALAAGRDPGRCHAWCALALRSFSASAGPWQWYARKPGASNLTRAEYAELCLARHVATRRMRGMVCQWIERGWIRGDERWVRTEFMWSPIPASDGQRVPARAPLPQHTPTKQ